MNVFGWIIFVVLHALQSPVSCKSYICANEEQCITANDHQINTEHSKAFSSLNNCRLLCGKYGPLWPRPTGYVFLGNQTIAINPWDVRFEQTLNGETTEGKTILLEIKRYFLRNLRKDCDSTRVNENASSSPLIIKLHILSNVTTLTWHTDESYKLIISNDPHLSIVEAEIEANTIFGSRHGLESLLQLFTKVNDRNSTTFSLHIISQANIVDKPTYPHRGIMIDTARNYIPIKILKRQLDAMAASKMNVFHWHMTDTQSFPVQLEKVPEMVAYGAYSVDEVYTTNDIEQLIQYAKYRGIRVIFELDAPAHAGNGWQWGPEKGLGNLAVCVNQKPWRNFCIEPPCGQLNPTNPNMYTTLQQIYEDLARMNKDETVMHMGGDEVFFGCWNSSSEIISYLAEHGMGRTESDFLALWSTFQGNAFKLWQNVTSTNQSITSNIAGENVNDSPMLGILIMVFGVKQCIITGRRYTITSYPKETAFWEVKFVYGQSTLMDILLTDVLGHAQLPQRNVFGQILKQEL
uniref:beta-N-acetylhexosaminidase n=1 Tax=Anopheles epiroticus TaxID=199890 RepID=A0A182PDH5_9DIPT